MNDTELDELLDIWKTPSPRPSLRASLQGEIAAPRARPPRKLFTRRRLWATAAALIFALLVVNPDAFSEKFIAYTVDSEITYYHGAEMAGLPNRMLMTSYNSSGTEVIQSWSYPGYPVGTAYLKAWIAARRAAERLERLAWPFKKIAKHYYIFKYGLATPKEEPVGPKEAYATVYPDGPAWPLDVGRPADLVSSGCRTNHGGATVVGQGVVLNYATTVLQQRHRGGAWKLTLWMAPELSCFALRATIHEAQPDGSWKLISEKKALTVTVKR
jgi:hypothetical protein